jgi:hypothetical protein
MPGIQGIPSPHSLKDAEIIWDVKESIGGEKRDASPGRGKVGNGQILIWRGCFTRRVK